jgi:hypothetical protein
VRKLVGSLSRRTDLWRAAVKGDADWAATARGSLYKEGVAPDALRHSAGALERIWSTLQAADFAQIAAGDIG